MAAESLVLRTGATEFAATRQASADGATVVSLASGDAWEARKTDSATYRISRGEQSSLAVCAADDSRQWVFINGEVYIVEVRVPQQANDDTRTRRASSSAHSLAAPMPASVRKIMVAVGQSVKKGETLLVLEAMKMEMPVKSPVDGVVKKINCHPNQLVQPGVQLIELE